MGREIGIFYWCCLDGEVFTNLTLEQHAILKELDQELERLSNKFASNAEDEDILEEYMEHYETVEDYKEYLRNRETPWK